MYIHISTVPLLTFTFVLSLVKAFACECWFVSSAWLWPYIYTYYAYKLHRLHCASYCIWHLGLISRGAFPHGQPGHVTQNSFSHPILRSTLQIDSPSSGIYILGHHADTVSLIKTCFLSVPKRVLFLFLDILFDTLSYSKFLYKYHLFCYDLFYH
jgi:hypothetical protein